LGESAWKALLQYVDKGGNLLITGPVNRDEHWQAVDRAHDLGLAAHSEPLVYHNAEIRVGGRPIALAFGQAQQNSLDSLRFDDGATLQEIPRGKGRIYWASYPVELAEDPQSVADLYAYVAAHLSLMPAFKAQRPVPHGILILPITCADAMIYVLVSDSADDARIAIQDNATGAQIDLTLPAEHAAMAVMGKRGKNVVAKYGF
jgi:hypothetical protein